MKYYEHPGRRSIRIWGIRPLHLTDESERFTWTPGEVADPLREARILEHIARVRADPRWEGEDEEGCGHGGGYYPSEAMVELCRRRRRAGWSVYEIASRVGLSERVVARLTFGEGEADAT